MGDLQGAGRRGIRVVALLLVACLVAAACGTRLTSQQETYEGAADDSSANADDLDPSEADRDDKAGTDKGAATGDQSSAEDEQNAYVRCDHVKQ